MLVCFINRDVPPAYMQRKWHKLKVCHVPEWQRKSFAGKYFFLCVCVCNH